MSEQLQLPVELPVESVKAYVVGEQITPYNFDLLQNYFEGRIIKLLDSNDAWRVIDAQSVSEKQTTVEALIALIKGEGENK